MSCSATIQNVTANGQGNGSVLHITVLTDGCKGLQLDVLCGGATYTQFYVLGAATTVTEDIVVACPCGSAVSIKATCVDPATHLPSPGCTVGSYQGPIPCQNECCIVPVITVQAGACNADNQRTVTFTTVFTVPSTLPTACFPLAGQLHFGNTQLGQFVYLTAPGVYTFTDTTLYDAINATSYQAFFHYANPNCPDVAVNFKVDPCGPTNCCPTVNDVAIEVGDCGSDCTRHVKITTSFAPPVPGCLAETFYWQFRDHNGNAITNVNSPPFLTSGASPNVQSWYFNPALAPITATLTGLQYPHCPPIVRTINLTACNEDPECPVIHSFTANVMGCENVDGRCQRRVEFNLDAQIFAGCGSNAGTKIEIDFGNGDQAQLQFAASGQQNITVSHHYDGGTYPVTLSVINPTACEERYINVVVPPCNPEDCNIPSPCPTPAQPPWWCLCILCNLFSQKPGKGYCKAMIVVVALLVSMAIVALALGWVSISYNPQLSVSLNLLHIVGAACTFIGSAFLLWFVSKCSPCCAACAVLLAMVLAVITIIVFVIYGIVPIAWFSAVSHVLDLAGAFIGAFMVWLVLRVWCKHYASQYLTEENWCKGD